MKKEIIYISRNEYLLNGFDDGKTRNICKFKIIDPAHQDFALIHPEEYFKCEKEDLILIVLYLKD